MRHVLVTNDFPPKVGGIQSYLWELWRRLPPDDVTVLTTSWPGAAEFDRAQPYRVERVDARVLLPSPGMVRRIEDLAREVSADLVVLDPALPIGLVGPRLSRPYALVMHGSELLGRLPVGSPLMGRVVRSAATVIAAGGYPAAEARRVGGSRTPTIVKIPPGVDHRRFRPLSDDERLHVRRRLGLPAQAPVVLGLSRLVRRKGFDVVIEAAARLRSRHPDITVAIAGSGRDRDRVAAVASRSGIDVRLLGRVADEQLPEVYGAADVFCMLCHDRWAGLEKEGFGIVFLEAAACGVPQVAGDSGGAADAVADGTTGLVVANPTDVDDAAAALDALLGDAERRRSMGEASRRRAVEEFDYDVLATRLAAALSTAVHT